MRCLTVVLVCLTAIGLGNTAFAQSKVVIDECRILPRQWVRLATDRIGVIASIEPEEGDAVEKGAIVVKLKDEVPQSVVNKAQKKIENDVEVRYAVAAHNLAVGELAANQAVNAQRRGAIADTEIERLKLAATKAKLQIEQADHQRQVDALDLQEAKAQLNSYRIFAPFPGIVIRRYKDVGEAIQQGETVLEVVRTDLLKVEGNIEIERLNAHGIKTGSAVMVQYFGEDRKLKGGDVILPGKIIFVDSVVQAVTRRVRIVAEVVNPDGRLQAGLSATMTIDPTVMIKKPVQVLGSAERKIEGSKLENSGTATAEK
ncbi:MAG: efflux RND transporter periplasmic adaptor subunit [Planctomycetota bacterium]|nr:efflux RND transporter periplasmic adaptor subunit [Planctomycetota bacterium]